MNDENLEELYENLADLDDEEWYDSEDDAVEDDEYDDEDNIAEDPGNDENWWHGDEDDVSVIIATNDQEPVEESDIIEQVTLETIDYRETTEIESATTGRELFDAIADLFEKCMVSNKYGETCDVEFVTKSEFDALPDEDKYQPKNEEWYESTDDDQEDDDIDLTVESKPNKVYFIVDAYD